MQYGIGAAMQPAQDTNIHAHMRMRIFAHMYVCACCGSWDGKSRSNLQVWLLTGGGEHRVCLMHGIGLDSRCARASRSSGGRLGVRGGGARGRVRVAAGAGKLRRRM